MTERSAEEDFGIPQKQELSYTSWYTNGLLGPNNGARACVVLRPEYRLVETPAHAPVPDRCHLTAKN